MTSSPGSSSSSSPAARPWLSRALRFLWWLLFITPLISLLVEYEAGNAASADEALGSAFIMAPLMLFLLVTGFVVLIAALFNRGQSRTAGITLSLSSVPVILLVAWTSEVLGWSSGRRDTTMLEIFSVVAGSAVTLGLLLLFRRQFLKP